MYLALSKPVWLHFRQSNEIARSRTVPSYTHILNPERIIINANFCQLLLLNRLLFGCNPIRYRTKLQLSPYRRP